MLQKYKKIDNIMYHAIGLWFLIPIVILIFFWTKIYISIPIILILGFLYKFYIKNKSVLTEEEYVNIFNFKKWIIIIIALVGINLLSGAGGLFYQNWDYSARNAVLDDLIEYDWPVKYDLTDSENVSINNGILSYYFTYWLPGAAVGKLLGFKAASLFLLLWQTLGTLLVFYMIMRYFKKTTIWPIFIFFMFSGLDVIQKIVYSLIDGKSIVFKDLIGRNHIDTVAGWFAFSSFTTQLFWVFNQALPAWLATMLLFNEKKYRYYGIILLFLIPYSPFPAVGLILLMALYTLFGFDLNKFIDTKRLKEIFSFENILCLIAVLPIFGLFFLNSGNHDSGLIFYRYNGAIYCPIIRSWIIFIFFEVGVYAIFVNKKKKNLMIAVSAILGLLPFFYIGIGIDFCNRASIPLLIVMFLLVCERLTEFSIKKFSKTWILLMIIVIGSITSMNEIYRSLRTTFGNFRNHESNFTHNWGSYSETGNEEMMIYFKNFVSPYDKEKILYKYIIK